MRGESILQVLLETIATSEESKRKTTRAGSAPPRQPTPVNSAPAQRPSTRAGSVTPAVRPRSQASNYSVPNKRQRLGDSTSSIASSSTQPPPAPPTTTRRPLSSQRRGNSTRSAKMPSKSLPRQPTIEMVVPKPGTQQHSLGHGRLPTSVIFGAGIGGSVTRSASTRFAAGQQTKANPAATSKRTINTQRESFKPRPSIDVVEQRATVASASSGKWGGGFTVAEE